MLIPGDDGESETVPSVAHPRRHSGSSDTGLGPGTRFAPPWAGRLLLVGAAGSPRRQEEHLAPRPCLGARRWWVSPRRLEQALAGRSGRSRRRSVGGDCRCAMPGPWVSWEKDEDSARDMKIESGM